MAAQQLSPGRDLSLFSTLGELQTTPQGSNSPLPLSLDAVDQIPQSVSQGITEHLRNLQASFRKLDIEQDKNAHVALDSANRIVSDLIELTETTEALSIETLLQPLDRLLDNMKILDTDPDGDGRSTFGKSTFRPWKRIGHKANDKVKGIAKDIRLLATLIRINSDLGKQGAQDLHKLMETKEQESRDLLQKKDRELRQLERQLLFLEPPPSSPGGNNVDQEPLKDQDLSLKVEQPQIRSILKTLYHPSSPYKDLVDSNFKRHEHFHGHRLARTCLWFLRSETFGSWLDGASQLLWCWGAAGAGKSTITSLVIDRLASKGNGVNCAFYHLGYGKVQSATGLVLSLIEQLCADNQYLPPSLDHFVVRNPYNPESSPEDPHRGALPTGTLTTETSEIGESSLDQSAREEASPWLLSPDHLILSESGSEQIGLEREMIIHSSTLEQRVQYNATLDHQPTLQVLFNALGEVSREISGDTFIILDDWDEFNMDSEDDFRHLLGMLQSLPWKICITSREQPTLPTSTPYSQIHIQENDNVLDIRAFITKATEYTFQGYESFGKEIIERLVEISQGIFLWAKLSLEMISVKPNQARIDTRALRYLFWTLPSKPENIIRRALEAVEKKVAGAGEISKTAIIWLTTLKRPLSLAALVESLNMVIDSHSEKVDDSVLDWCDELAVMDEGNSCVHLAHNAIDEVAKDLWANSYHAEMFKLVLACMKYLLLQEFERGCCETEEELIQLLEAHPFLDYAARTWAHHRRDACDFPSDHTTMVSKDRDTNEIASSQVIYDEKGFQDGEPIVKANPSDHDGDTNHNNVDGDDVDKKSAHTSVVESRSDGQNIATRLLETPNIRLALQVLLYRDKAAVPFANQWAVHQEKINSMSKVHIAARFGVTALIDEWAADSAGACEQDSEGSNPLHEAAKEGFEDVLERLLKDKRLSVLGMNIYKKTPLHYAKARGHPRSFSLMFENACMDIRKDYNEFLKIEDGEDFIPYYSINCNGISDNPERSKELALIKAINRQKEDLAIVLLSGDVDPSCKDEEQVPALHLAARHGMTSVVEGLLDQGADPLSLDGQGRTVLLSALETSDSPRTYDMMRFLLRQGVDLDRRDAKGRHVLHVAAQMGNKRILELLMFRMEDYSPRDNEGNTPLDYAREAGRTDLEQTLDESIG